MNRNSTINSPPYSHDMFSATHPTIVSSAYTPTIVQHDDHGYDGNMVIHMSPYEIDYQSLYSQNCSQPIHLGQPMLQTTLAHLTPISTASTDITEAITPLSLNPPFEFSDSRRSSILPALDTSVEIAPPSRPRSSPGTLQPSVQNPWAVNSFSANDGLGIQITPPQTHKISPAPTPRPRHQHSISSISDSTPLLATPQPRHWTPIAPNPLGIMQIQTGTKRSYSEDDYDSSPVHKRKRSSVVLSPSPIPNHELTPENQLLLRLRDEENLSWKDIQARFEKEMGKTYRIATLQMRLTRLRERMRSWSEMDVQALRMAHEYWYNSKFDIIANKMADYGATEKWSAKQCHKKWQEVGLQTEHIFQSHFQSPTAGFVQTLSPGPMNEGFYTPVLQH